jgi:hypothetical protein
MPTNPCTSTTSPTSRRCGHHEEQPSIGENTATAIIGGGGAKSSSTRGAASAVRLGNGASQYTSPISFGNRSTTTVTAKSTRQEQQQQQQSHRLALPSLRGSFNRESREVPGVPEVASPLLMFGSEDNHWGDNASKGSNNITRAVVVLRATVFVLLVLTATLLSVGVFYYTKSNEQAHFQDDFERNARLVLDAFEEAVEHRLGAINTMANSITSHALATNQTFPMVTIPDFALRGADFRIQATAPVMHWLPLVSDDNRDAWEAYALENRFQIDEAFQQDQEMRQRQDEMLGFDSGASGGTGGGSGIIQPPPPPPRDNNTLDDGTGYHPRIHSYGEVTPEGDEADGTGPFLPVWQRR